MVSVVCTQAPARASRYGSRPFAVGRPEGPCSQCCPTGWGASHHFSHPVPEGWGSALGTPLPAPPQAPAAMGAGAVPPQEMLVTELLVGRQLGLEARRCWGLRSGPLQPCPAPTPAPGVGERPWVVLARPGGFAFACLLPPSTPNPLQEKLSQLGCDFHRMLFASSVRGDAGWRREDGGCLRDLFGCCFPCLG